MVTLSVQCVSLSAFVPTEVARWGRKRSDFHFELQFRLTISANGSEAPPERDPAAKSPGTSSGRRPYRAGRACRAE
jgi:hypothetical protein